MPEQIITQVMPYVPLISLFLLLLVELLLIIHIRQVRRINRSLSEAEKKLQNYLEIVLSEPEQEKLEEGTELTKEVTVAAPDSIQSRQELNMRGSLEKRQKQKDEEQLLDSVLQEIFD